MQKSDPDIIDMGDPIKNERFVCVQCGETKPRLGSRHDVCFKCIVNSATPSDYLTNDQRLERQGKIFNFIYKKVVNS